MGVLRLLAKPAAILGIPIGIISTVLGVYGLAGGSGISFIINGRVVTPQEGGTIFTIIGIITLLVGIVCYYYGFRKKKEVLLLDLLFTGIIWLLIISAISATFTVIGIIGILLVGIVCYYYGFREKKEVLLLDLLFTGIILLVISAIIKNLPLSLVSVGLLFVSSIEFCKK